MKNFIVSLIVLVIYSYNVLSQEQQSKYDVDRNCFYFGVGGYIITFNHYGLNKAIDYYNSYVQPIEKLRKINSAGGLLFNFGYLENKFFNGVIEEINVGYFPLTFNSQVDNFTKYRFKIELYYFSNFIGYYFEQNNIFDLGFGFGIDLPYFRYYHAINDEKFELAGDEDFLGTGFSFSLMVNWFPLTKSLPISIKLKPYYYFFDFAKSYFSNYDDGTIFPDAYYSVTGYGDKFNHLGMQVSLNINLFGKKQKSTEIIKNENKKNKKKTHGFQ